MKRLLTLLKIEGKLVLRMGDGIFFGVIMPVGIALLIGFISGNKPAFEGSSYTYLQENVPAIITVGICATAFMGIPLTIADYRDKKILKHYFVTPISPFMVLFVQVIINMITAIVSSLAVLIAMKIFFGYEMSGNIANFIFAYFLVMASMYGFGMLISSLCRSVKQANLVCTIIYFPMLFLSGATIPFSILPSGLQKVSSVLPLTQGIKLLKGYALGIENGLLTPLSVMIISMVLTAVLSIKLFKWE